MVQTAQPSSPLPFALVDGSYYAHRGHHAYPRMMAAGHPTGALFGFANALAELSMAELGPEHGGGLVAFAGPSTFRSERHADYAGHRPTPPPEVAAQWTELQALAEALGYSVLNTDGFEPLDLFASLIDAAPEREFVVVGGDRRYRAFASDRVRVYEVLGGQWSDPGTVKEQLGISPSQIAELVALSGDGSMGIPGISGIGEKTAAQLLVAWGSLEGVLGNASTIKGKRGELVSQGAQSARLSLVLAAPHPEFAAAAALPGPSNPHVQRLHELYTRWQFRTHLEALSRLPTDDEAPRTAATYRAIRTEVELLEALAQARAAGRVAVDLETTSLDPLKARIVGASLAWTDSGAVYIPLGHMEGGALAPGQIPAEAAWRHLAPFFADPTVAKVGQNLKYDISVLRANGRDLHGLAGDTMLADYLLEPDQIRHGLDDLALRYLGHRNISYSEVTSGRPDSMSFAEVAIEKATEYAAEDAHIAWLLDEKLAPMLRERGLCEVYEKIEVPLVPVLAAMESEGIGVDKDSLQHLSVELGERLAQAEQEVYEIAGHPFAIQSPKQLAAVLFEERGLKPLKKTKTGPSTDADTLEILAAQDPLPAKILEYRSLAKLKSTYVDALPECISTVDGRIHTSFHQAVAATGRLSSNNPNLQNIPVRTADGRRIRACFKARPGHVFLSLDYSQVELRILAHLCGDGPLVESFLRGEDIHRRTAAEIFGVPLGDVNGEQRRAAKAINFGIVYGMGPMRLAADLRISRSAASEYLDNYFARYPQVKRVQTELVDSARQRGYAETLWGRRRPIPDLSAPNQRDRNAAERIALNTPIQGSAADLIKRAMLEVHSRLQRQSLPAKLLLQVHDELVLEVTEECTETVAAAVREEMEGAATLCVPLVVDVGQGADWNSAH